MIDIRPFLSLDFWFGTNVSGITSGSQQFLFAIFAVLLVLGAIIRMVASRQNLDKYVTAMFAKLGNMGVVMGAFGLVILFFSYEQVAFLGNRFWYLIWIICLIWWIVRIVIYATKTVPKLKEEAEEKEKQNAYIPKRKK